ncbi:uncharacterized protein OCT59_000423 [Rhizophagus irregularis]|uniref:uncharacterized protein n=1 Tax=Rhizophagus irregularis TaxID=588596 RepID=UPI00332AA435|nr:hypothetical protein OCT59_000423 [Rhizophagus irregularis]
MACSKLFSGYLPELIDEIIQYFRNDISTLHSCILVNRLWCRSAISLLWEDPFSLIHVQNFRFVEIYLRNLNEDDKAKLNEYGINNNLLLLSSTLFNYPSFIKRLNTHKVGHSIENWLSTLMDNNYDKQSIHIIYCKSLNSQFVQQMVSVIIPFKLKTLIISEILQVESLQLLLQRFGNDLENFGFNSCDYDFSNKELIQNNINLTLSLIENIKQNLNYLSIEIDFFVHSLNYNTICSIVLQNLGQILPSKLEFLRLGLKIGQNDLKIFLENSKNTFINRLFIRNMYYDINEDILSCIKEFIMKKKRVKYLAIYNIYQDLIDLKGEVNEFKLYDIIIQRYEDFFIQTYDIVNSYL